MLQLGPQVTTFVVIRPETGSESADPALAERLCGFGERVIRPDGDHVTSLACEDVFDAHETSP